MEVLDTVEIRSIVEGDVEAIEREEQATSCNGEGVAETIEREEQATPSGKQGAMLRAYDKATGKGVGAVYMPQGQTGTPMTYTVGGKQYIVLAIAGPGFPAEFIAYKLPN